MEELFAWLGLADDAVYTRIAQSILHILLIVILAGVLLRVARKAISVFHQRVQKRTEDQESLKRLETLTWATRYLVTVVVMVVSAMLILAAVGISIAPILAAAGVVGIAVGVGAQSLVKDYFTGFVLLLENQIRQGDVVQIAGKSGLVEEVTLRYVRMRDFDGNVHFVPNGIIDSVTNMTRVFSYALIDVGVGYREDLDKVFQLIRETAGKMREDPVFGPKILEDIDLAGVENWADSAVMIRCRIKTVPIEQWNVKREFLRRLKAAFDKSEIEIPFPHRTIDFGQSRDSSASTFLSGGASGERKLPDREESR
jgi:small-conductance mechanosensitive channel